MFDRTTINTEIFKDTEQRYRTNENLKEAVKNSIAHQKLILANDVRKGSLVKHILSRLPLFLF